MSTPLPDDIDEALAEAWLEYTQKLRSILKPLGSERLRSFAGEIPEVISYSGLHGCRTWVERQNARYEAMFQEMSENAQRVFAEGATSYCPFHDCDGSKCTHEDSDG